MNKITLDMTISEYNDSTVVGSYEEAVDSIGLWESEKLIFGKYLRPGMKILDIGCGAGRTTFNLYKLGYRDITGFDLSAAMIAACKKRAANEKLPIDFIVGNACNTGLGGNIYDACIFSFNGIMTIPLKENRTKVFSEVYRMLKDGGLFIFTTHDIKNEKYLKYWADEKARWDEGSQDKRLHEYGDMTFTDQKSDGSVEAFVHVPTYEEIYKYAADSGFVIIEQSVRSRLCEEKEITRKNSGDCIFWVIKK